MSKIVFTSLEIADGRTLEVSTENTSYYRHVGELAMYDHIYIHLGPDEGYYMWPMHPVFEALLSKVIENGCEMSLNLRDVAENDKEAFEKMMEQQSSDINQVPEDWAGQI